MCNPNTSTLLKPTKLSQVFNEYTIFHKYLHGHPDDAIRENWEKYGNPDGPQAMSIGIALPSWLVKKDNTYVGMYLLH